MAFDIGRWATFGAKFSFIGYLLTFGIIALVATLLFSSFGIDLSQFAVALTIGGLVFSVIFGGAIWVILGWLYENLLEKIIGKLPVWLQVSILGTISTYTQSLISGGSATVALLIVFIPLFIITVILAVIILVIFSKLDWDVPFNS